MKRTKIAPTLAALLEDRRRLGASGQVIREAEAELRALLAVARAAASDPDPHHRVESALARLRRLSAPERDAKRATRKGGGR